MELNQNVMLINPKLAMKLGHNEAIVLSQVNYWINKLDNVRDGKKWVFNSISAWTEQFPWISESTVKRAFKSLRDKGLLIVSNYNKHKMDKTLWYTIDFDKLNELLNDEEEKEESADIPEETIESNADDVTIEGDEFIPFDLPENVLEVDSNVEEAKFTFIYDNYDFFINGGWLDE